MGLKSNKKFIIGVDEAGRGPLAGPITIGAIVIGPLNSRPAKGGARLVPPASLSLKRGERSGTAKSKILKDIKDSKKLTPRQREKWLEILKNNFEYKTASISSKIIDRIGIQKAVSLAVARVLHKIVGAPTSDKLVLLDGLLKAPKQYNQKTIIKGDEKIPIISAASIVAKVTRDKKMLRFHKKYPQYGFDKHKGYGTRHHYKMLKRHGPCPIHRKTFRLS